ncbi:hypothetical protein [Mycobacterium sp. E787]|uniref:hypothetical protein n=1 Tax=Mycobacterium sp. E787 TaxID=1834150 RepID=UPI0007FEBE46|nr:hypothetical protein [Mycobacterium sp. E787]OBI53588.1 hypothetical protein A5705_02945 [Mycobacterium sp. E787]
MKEWIKRHICWLALAFAALALVLLVVVGVQAVMLYSENWRPAFGSLPEYLAALGSFATFGVLWFAAREWRRGERERRDREAGQARLIVAEHEPFINRSYSGMDPPEPGRRNVVIHNRSTEPVFALHIEEYATGSDVRVFQNSASGRIAPSDMAVLAADQSTEPLGILGGDPHTPSTEHVEFMFTDPRQARWRKRGNGEPERALD